MTPHGAMHRDKFVEITPDTGYGMISATTATSAWILLLSYWRLQWTSWTWARQSRPLPSILRSFKARLAQVSAQALLVLMLESVRWFVNWQDVFREPMTPRPAFVVALLVNIDTYLEVPGLSFGADLKLPHATSDFMKQRKYYQKSRKQSKETMKRQRKRRKEQLEWDKENKRKEEKWVWNERMRIMNKGLLLTEWVCVGVVVGLVMDTVLWFYWRGGFQAGMP
eukprot:comp23111_c0_seq1/m.37211 comp23111_c0_seq1/g.37211  ORF comp23111_c0_seq1/g.37211 comp23111_c0_seq1/m.37211 type:complete len:224 (-) comp23111_c0_seq1:435-1106(-)